MSKTPRILAVEKAIHGNKTLSDIVAVPFTSVYKNGQPRKIADQTDNLKASFGVERIHIRSFTQSRDEFGPSGEIVHKVKDERVRLIGSGWSSGANDYGTYVYSNTVNDYVEITFYGTGLVLLGVGGNTTTEYRATVDGGAEDSNFYTLNSSNVLGTRNYESNTKYLVTKGLSLGWHTVKIRLAVVGARALNLYGFDILNESSQLVVNSGKSFLGFTESDQSLFALKPSEITGTKGGRVVAYLKEDGTIGRSVTEVDVIAQYLSSANHSNEDVVRKINFREFGRNRGDDFSTISGVGVTNRAFTLDDGTTTLIGYQIGQQVNNGVDCGIVAAGGKQWTFSFVGTGLDIMMSNLAYTGIATIFIDGVSVGTIDNIYASKVVKVKIASGLAYGTHVVTVVNTSLGGPVGGFGISDFIVYQPKKPTLPETIVQEIADYNVVADFSHISSPSGSINNNQDSSYISTGVVRKAVVREADAVGGGWFIDGPNPFSYVTGFGLLSLGNANYIEFSFFGTGAILRGYSSNNRSVGVTVSLDGLPYNTTNYASQAPASQSAYIGHPNTSFTAATGVLDIYHETVTDGLYSLPITGLSLGWHKVRLTNDASGNRVDLSTVDVITPIHINSKDLKIGSLSLMDMRKDNEIVDESGNKVDLTRAKAWIVFNGVSSVVYSSMNISAMFKVSNGTYKIFFEKQFLSRFYAVIGSQSGDGGFDIDQGKNYPAWCEVVSRDNAGNASSPDLICIAFLGELENEEEIDLGDL